MPQPFFRGESQLLATPSKGLTLLMHGSSFEVFKHLAGGALATPQHSGAQEPAT